MIHSFRRTKWLALVKIPVYNPTQFPSVLSSERLRFLSALVLAQDNRKSSFSVSSLIDIAPESDVGRLKSPKKAKLVLKFLEENGFSESQIKIVVSQRPRILQCDPEKTLKPKAEFLFSKGISKLDFTRIVLEEPTALSRSLEKYMMPLFDFLKGVMGSEELVARAVRSCPYVFSSNIRKTLELNTKKLQNTGVPQARIAMLVTHQLRAITLKASWFDEALTRVREMGFEPTEPNFVNALATIGWCGKSVWERKMNLFRSYGLSDPEIMKGFKKQPMIMKYREENTKTKMNFFIKRLHWCPHKVMMAPHILLPSLEKRIIPRLSVLHLLVTRGEIEEKEISSAMRFLKMAEREFVEKFVAAYKDRIPGILETNEGKLKREEDLHTLNKAFIRNEFWSRT
ncbi:PREDICTED: transcription termination factor MTERF8, chloroplastic-like [Tarenaya hassleriana]|uniref:transcription termination factor MTERF8, chloroplastic-like n=1 Tax=Tarenaya hassleriana TaxID=28532 RepID=UPI0008FD17BC|nr:PREDICTED: transcription termination factor MTERF8, chloroplastic-like [Tarenaya hassleriana]